MEDGIKMEYEHYVNPIPGLVALIIMLAIALLVTTITYRTRNCEREETRERWAEIEETYEIFVDGIKVDADNVNVDWYRVEIDDEAGKVLLTPKID